MQGPNNTTDNITHNDNDNDNHHHHHDYRDHPDAPPATPPPPSAEQERRREEQLDAFGNVWQLLDDGQWVRQNPHRTAEEMLVQNLRNIAYAQCGPLVSSVLEHRVPEVMRQYGVVTAEGLRGWFAEKVEWLRGDLASEVTRVAEDLAGAWEDSLDDLHGLVTRQDDWVFGLAADHADLRDRLERVEDLAAMRSPASVSDHDALRERLEGIEERLWVVEEEAVEASIEARLDARIDTYEGNVDARLEASEAKLDAYQGNVDARLEASEAKLDAYQGNVDARLEASESKLEARFRALEARLDASEARNAELVADNERLRALVESSVQQTQASIEHSKSMGEPLRESVALLREDWKLRTAEFDTKIGAVKKLVSSSMAKATDRVEDVESLFNAAQVELGVLHKELSNVRTELATIKRAIDPVEAQEIDAKTWEKLQIFIQEHRDGATEEEMRAFLRTHFGGDEQSLERSMAAYWPPISMAMQRCAEDKKQAAAAAGATRSKNKGKSLK